MTFKPMTFPAIGGTWTCTPEQYAEWCELFPEQDVLATLRDALAWAKTAPPKKNVQRFFANWLIRNRQNGTNLRIVRTSMPSFTGTDYAIKRKENIWRKQPHLTRAEVDDLYQREQEHAAGEREPSNIHALGDLLKAGES